MNVVRALAHTKATVPNGLANTIDFVSSTATVDRTGEVIDQSGWRLDNYRSNPVFQNCHRYGDVLHTLGRAVVTEVREINGSPALFQRIAFAVEANPVARVAYGLYRDGFLNAVSVGFRPIRYELGTRETEWSVRYLESELLEVSAVAIPANPEALALGLKSGAITEDDMRAALSHSSIPAPYTRWSPSEYAALSSLRELLLGSGPC